MHRFALILFLVISLSACNLEASPVTPTPVYDPFVPLSGAPPEGDTSTNNPGVPVSLPTRQAGPTPTLASLRVNLPPARPAGLPIFTPTPNPPRALPTLRQDADQYVVQSGDTLGGIAQKYGVSLGSLMQVNGLEDANLLSVGQTLTIPAPEPGEQGTPFKIIPDSELVFGPASTLFNTDVYVQQKGGYLSEYTEEVNGEILEGWQIIDLVSRYYSVNPRLLLALLEHQSQWVTNPSPTVIEYPLGLEDPYHPGLYKQLTWTADTLNYGFYGWQANTISNWVLMDGRVIPVDPTINAGTAGVQHFFALLDDYFTWFEDVTPFGIFQTYFFMFGNPFDFAIEPLMPAYLPGPTLQLPFELGATWSFTGGPHGGWDSGSAWAALDFGPPGEAAGCTPSDEWVVAVADGWIVRSGDGAVMQDLDGDGHEQTGWVIFYMHIESRDRVPSKTYLYAGERIGHPSCEGGFSNGTHLHIARKYNGQWIPADGDMPFIMDGWVSSGDSYEYDGFLNKGNLSIEAWDGRNELNQISR